MLAEIISCRNITSNKYVLADLNQKCFSDEHYIMLYIIYPCLFGILFLTAKLYFNFQNILIKNNFPITSRKSFAIYVFGYK
jgi:hypothetical protein